MDIQTRFKIFCLKRNIKQKDLAAALGIYSNNISAKIKKGCISLKELTIIAEKLNLTDAEIVFLVREDGDPQNVKDFFSLS